MRTTIILVLALLGGLGPARAMRTEAELILLGPGDDVYSRFGHAAIRVKQPGKDRVFNFGVTNFRRPSYVIDFLRGDVKFYGIARAYSRTLERAKSWDRTVYRYPLALTPAQIDALLEMLEHDVKPEFREYQYDTFRDNCSTRLRDYLDQVTEGAVHAALADDPPRASFRDDVRTAFAAIPTLLLLTEVIPGRPLDAPRTPWELMYRPAVLGEALQRVTVRPEGHPVPLAGPPIIDYERQKPYSLTGWPHRGQAFIAVEALLVALMGLVLGRLGPRWRGGAVVLWVFAAAFIGLVLEIVALGTIWPDMQQNWLVLGFVSLDLWLLWPASRLLFRGVPYAGRVTRVYLGVRLAAVAFLILAGLLFDFARGPLPPRLLAAAGLFLIWRSLLPPTMQLLKRSSI